jgi:RsiW-degrading membrane proteinase PrsW (M82 family)
MFNGQEPLTIVLALLAGTIPSFIWLRYWIKGDDVKPEPLGLIALTFITGMLGVIAVLPIQKFFLNQFSDNTLLIVIWAACEEIIKYLACALIAFRTSEITEPIDYPIYLMTAALGFAALENTFFLIEPFGIRDTTVALLTTNLRFLGSTLLHSVCSGLIGLMLGLAFFQNKTIRFGSLIIGFIMAIGLHSIFNFFIMERNGENFLEVFAFLWVVSIISILVFEKVRRMSQAVYMKHLYKRYPETESAANY